MKINTTRFGEIDAKESEVITMYGSILGFEDLRHFVLLADEKNTPFWWLQSIQNPAVAFVVINPQIVKPDYIPHISEDDFEFLDIKKHGDMALFAILTVRSNPTRITANLRAPLLINASSRIATQIILSDIEQPIQYDVLDNRANFNKGLASDDRSGIASGLDKNSSAVATI